MTPADLAALSVRAYTHMAPWSAQAFADTLARPQAVLTLAPNAFALGLLIVDEVEILALAADPAFQRRGHASDALKLFHTDAQKRGANRVFLEVASRNLAAQAFYLTHGYTQAGRRKAYYPQPDGPADDALVLTRPLP